MQPSAWLRGIAVALILLAAVLPAAARALAGPEGATIHVRWQASVSEANRRDIETRRYLFDGRRIDQDTWQYDLAEPSRENIHELLIDPAVEDTHGLDRPNESLDPATGRTSRRQRFPDYGDQLVMGADLLAITSGALALLLTFVGAKRRRANSASRTPTQLGPLSASDRDVEPVAPGLDPEGRPRLWTAAVLLTFAPFLLALCLTLWRSPFPITEAVALFEDVENRPISHFFSPTTAYFRPLFHVMLSVLWNGIDNLDTTLALIKLVTIIPILLLVLLFTYCLRPRTALDAAAAILALSVLVGSPGFRDNLEIVLSYTIVGMAIALIVWILVNQERSRWHAPLIVVLTLVAVGFKEQGLVIVPVVIVAWWTGAPGASRGTAALLAVIAAVYVGLRLSGGASWELFQQDVGLGFGEIDKATASARFAAFPYWMYAYNSASTLGNMLVAEPTRGTFRIVRAVVNGEPELWQALHVISSAGTTGLITWWGVRSLKSQARDPWTLQSRLFVALIAALLACTALSFNYSRDRLGGMAVVFYALATFFAVREAASRLIAGTRVRLVMAGLGLAILAAAWQTRTFATLEYARVHSWGNQVEWFVRLPTRRLDFAHRPVYLTIMESMIEQGTDPSAPHPTRYPDWVLRTTGRP